MIKPNVGPKLLRPKDIPAEYGISERCIRRYITEKKFPVVKFSGKTGPVFIKRSDLEKFIEGSTIPAAG